MTRRARLALPAICFLLGLALPVATAAAAETALPQINRGGVKMSAQEAYDAAQEGAIVLLDIRSPEEWTETGVPLGATAITMHQHPESLLRGVRRIVSQANGKPLAVICAHGVRSAYLQDWLARRGIDRVITVFEGMEGGNGGVGWLKAGLPVAKWSGPTSRVGTVKP